MCNWKPVEIIEHKRVMLLPVAGKLVNAALESAMQGPLYRTWDMYLHTAKAKADFRAHHADAAALWHPDDWRLNLAAMASDPWTANGVVGVQTLRATDFANTRTVHMAMWVGASHQRRGGAKIMGQAAISFAHHHLGATTLVHETHPSNAASCALAESLGYTIASTGDRVVRYELHPPADTPDVKVYGLKPWMFGL